MSYASCIGNLDEHYSRTCGETGEKGRVRMGALIHESEIANVRVDPTDAASWAPGIASGKIKILKELSGTMDGGTPKMVPGFGSKKEEFAGMDFKANIKDPKYAENWAFYRSLVGAPGWYFAYCTESKVHITGAEITAVPKNPMTENIDDSVIWECEVSWFEFFTPAPHEIPFGIFI